MIPVSSMGNQVCWHVNLPWACVHTQRVGNSSLVYPKLVKCVFEALTNHNNELQLTYCMVDLQFSWLSLCTHRSKSMWHLHDCRTISAWFGWVVFVKLSQLQWRELTSMDYNYCHRLHVAFVTFPSTSNETNLCSDRALVYFSLSLFL